MSNEIMNNNTAIELSEEELDIVAGGSGDKKEKFSHEYDEEKFSYFSFEKFEKFFSTENSKKSKKFDY